MPGNVLVQLYKRMINDLILLYLGKVRGRI